MSVFSPVLLVLALCWQGGSFIEPCQGDSCSTGNSTRSASLYFYGAVNRVLEQGYRKFTGASKQRCGKECLSDYRCFSFNYSDREKLCELNGASATRFPLALTERTGTWYYGPEKPRFLARLLALVHTGSPGLTDHFYETQVLASADCQRAGQHLCELWEVEQAYGAGYDAILPIDTSLWYAVPDSQAVVSGSGVTQHGLPVVSSSAICCMGPQLPPQHPLITPMTHAVADREGMASACSDLAAHLCTRAELKAAYLRGYRQPFSAWMLLAMPVRDAQLHSDGCGLYTDVECYEGVVANTPRPHEYDRVYCCPNLY